MLKTAGPLFEQVDPGEEQEREHEQNDRQSDRPSVVELLQPHNDQVRSNLRFERKIAGDENNRAVFADSPRERHA